MSDIEEARALHARHPAIDLHADTLMWGRWFGYDLLTRFSQVLISRLQATRLQLMDVYGDRRD